MASTDQIDWTDVDAAARDLAGNWRGFDCFAWSRGYDLPDADNWLIHYTTNRDSGLLDQSNEQAIIKRLEPFTEGDDPDVMVESHSHWAVGYVDGFSLRVLRPDGTITDAFREFCGIRESLENYPVLDEADYSEREWNATLENYSIEMWSLRNDLPEGWEGEVYEWFSDNGHHRYIENRDDQGGYADREAIIEALQDLGLLPSVVIEEGKESHDRSNRRTS